MIRLRDLPGAQSLTETVRRVSKADQGGLLPVVEVDHARGTTSQAFPHRSPALATPQRNVSVTGLS